MKNSWVIRDSDSKTFLELSRIAGIDPVLSQILTARGIDSLEKIDSFLSKDLYRLESPFLISNMHSAVTRFRNAINKSEKIGIFTDSDVDGLSSLAVMDLLLKKAGASYIYDCPSDEDGYGLSFKIVDKFAEKKITLLITLDCGSRDCDEISYAKNKGIDVLVIDHHENGPVLPDAIIVNPKHPESLCSSKEISGAAVSFKFVQAFLLSYLPIFNKHCYLFYEVNSTESFFCMINGIEVNTPSDIKETIKRINLSDSFVFIHNSSTETKKLLSAKGIDFISLNNAFASEMDKSGKEITNFINEKSKIYGMTDIFRFLINDYLINSSQKIKDTLESAMSYLALGTIADIVPLTGENRIISKIGIKKISTSNSEPFLILKNKFGNKIDSNAIAWKIAPFLNSPGRLGTPLIASEFMLGKNPIGKYFNEINNLNNKRKELTEKALSLSIPISEKQIDSGKKIIFIDSIEINDGITGLVAGRLSEKFNLPVIIVSEIEGTLLYRGSGRYNGECGILVFFEKHSDLFLKFGGHKNAFGFTITREKIEALKSVIQQISDEFVPCEKKFTIDMEIDPSIIKNGFFEILKKMEPFGQANLEPVFLTRNIEIRNFSHFGTDNAHGKYLIKDCELEMVGWKMKELMAQFFEKKYADVLYHIKKDSYSGKAYAEIIDIS